MKRFRKFFSLLILIVLIFTMAGCTAAERVSHNISKEADYFNVVRQLTVINVRSDDILFQMTGKISIQNSTTNELVVLVETPDGKFHKHFIYLNSWTTYVVEDISGADVTQYEYTMNFNPKMWNPADFDYID